MPKKQTKVVAPTVRLRRSKPAPVETEPLTDEEQLVVDSMDEEEPEQIVEFKPKKVAKSRAPRKPKAVIDYAAEKKAFDEYVSGERTKLKAEIEAAATNLKAEAKLERKSAANVREERLRLMSGINF